MEFENVFKNIYKKIVKMSGKLFKGKFFQIFNWRTRKIKTENQRRELMEISNSWDPQYYLIMFYRFVHKKKKKTLFFNAHASDVKLCNWVMTVSCVNAQFWLSFCCATWREWCQSHTHRAAIMNELPADELWWIIKWLAVLVASWKWAWK